MPEAITPKICACSTCGGEMIQKSKGRLILVGMVVMASLGICFFIRLFWAPGILLGLTGFYLLIWATLGKARWCRNCKKFSVQNRN
jgi:hypothetical protein